MKKFLNFKNEKQIIKYNKKIMFWGKVINLLFIIFMILLILSVIPTMAIFIFLYLNNIGFDKKNLLSVVEGILFFMSVIAYGFILLLIPVWSLQSFDYDWWSKKQYEN